MKQHKFCPDKQQHNNAKLFPVHFLEVEEVENWNNYYDPDVLHQNDSFALFGKFCLKTGMYMNFYFIAAS